MTTILHFALGNGLSGAPSLATLASPVVPLELPSENADVASLRSAVEAAPDAVSAFLLSVGAETPAQVPGNANWDERVLQPLRRAFGLLTGAGRRFRQAGHGTIAVLVPSAAIGLAGVATPQLVLLRSIVGMAEALRAELQATGVRVSLVFYDSDDLGNSALAARLEAAISDGPMYSLSDDITAERISAYFAPLLSALDQTSAGQPLPDIGPMAAVYDLVAAGAPTA